MDLVNLAIQLVEEMVSAVKEQAPRRVEQRKT